MSGTAMLSRSTSSNKARKGVSVQTLSQASRDEDESESSDLEFNLDAGLDKDETELELEKLIFGDSASFREGLKEFNLNKHEHGVEQEAEDERTGLEGLDDADVSKCLRITSVPFD